MTPAWERLTEGAQCPDLTFGPLTRTDIVRYQGASGDMNPIHHDEEFARSAGYPTVLSVGMLAAGYVATHAVDWLGPANVRRFRVRFNEQVWPGDLLTCSARVTRRYESNDERFVDIDLSCMRQTGGAAVTGAATFVVPD